MLLKNYVTIALRDMRKHKFFSLLNIFGLSVGLSVFILAALFVVFNLSFDRFHPNAKRIYGIVQILPSSNQEKTVSAILPAPFLPAMKSDYPEIEDGVRFTVMNNIMVTYNEKKFGEPGVYFVDPNFLDFFNFKLSQGNSSVLGQKNSMVITKSAALKYFGNENPVGQSFTFNNTVDVRITGVAEDPPLNSSMKFNFLVTFDTAKVLNKKMESWSSNTASAFVLLHKDCTPDTLKGKFPGFIKKYLPVTPETPERLTLFPLLDFRSKAENFDMVTYLSWSIPFEVLSFFIILAIIALLVVCINYMNLYTANSMSRAREIGMRKVIGASRFELIKQFLGESILMAFIALPISIIIYQFLRPAFISYIGQNCDIVLWHYPSMFPVILGVTLIVGIVAGSYPAFFLSAFNPLQVLKGSFKSGKKGVLTRKILVTIQFIFTIILVVFTIAVKSQLNYLYKMDFGFNRDNIITVDLNEGSKANYQTMKEKLLMNPDIRAVSAGELIPVATMAPDFNVIPEGKDGSSPWLMKGFSVDYDFIELYDIQIKQGRSFSRDFNDASNIIINETASRYLNWDNPVGKTLDFKGKKWMIIGIVKDFIYRDIHFKMEPLLLYMEPGKLNYMFIKTASSSSLSAVHSYIEQNWNTLEPSLPYQKGMLLENVFDNHYRYMTQMALTFGLIGGFAIFIASMGLLGLTSYVLAQKTKEIGIRKAIGASVPTIFKMLAFEFLGLIVLANIVGLPISYLLVDQFLQWGWHYRVSIEIGILVFSSILIFISSFLSIIYHTLKAAKTNPVLALKYE